MIGSTTKPLTTLMLAKLVELRKLNWDKPIQEALPSFKLADKDVTSQFQVKHTACACTGMPRRDMDIIFRSLKDADDTIKQLNSMQPTTGFGETFQYSNHLVAVGGFLGGNVYGKGTDLFSKYENAMNDLVFVPLGMHATRVRPRPEDLQNAASPHAFGLDNKMTPIPQSFDDFVYSIAPAGSIWSNLDDLAKYVKMELKKGRSSDGKVLFSEEQIEKRRIPGVKVDETTSYGLGLFLQKNRGVSVIGHDGNTLGFTHDLFFLPDHNIGMIVQTNAGNVNAFRNSLKQKLLEILLGAKPKSEAIVQSWKRENMQRANNKRERVSTRSEDSRWISEFVGAYFNKDLGSVKIIKSGEGFQFVMKHWSSDLATSKEKTGDKLLSLTSAPWSGGLELRASKEDGKKLILDSDQSTYIFQAE